MEHALSDRLPDESQGRTTEKSSAGGNACALHSKSGDKGNFRDDDHEVVSGKCAKVEPEGTFQSGLERG